MTLQPEKIGQFFEEHRGRLYAAAYGVATSTHDAEDAVQEAMLATLATYARPGSPEVDSLEGLIFTTTTNKARHIVKRRGRDGVNMDLARLDAAVAEELDEDPDLDRPDALRSALEELTEKQIAVLLDHYERGIPLGEIAEREGVNEATLRSRMLRSRQQMVPQLVERAMLTLAQAYGQTFAPRMAQRSEHLPLELVHTEGEVLCFGTPLGDGMAIMRQPVDPVPVADPSGARLLLDTHDVHAPRMALARGDEIEWVRVNRGLATHLELGVPLFATRRYFLTYPGRHHTTDSAIELAAEVWKAYRATGSHELDQQLARLASADLAKQLGAARELLGQRRAQEVVDALERRGFLSGRLEAHRRGLLGYGRIVLGDLAAARDDLARAISLEPTEWEWHLHAGLAASMMGDASGAATGVVRALICEGRGSGRVEGAVRWMPTLQSILEVPRLWRLLEQPRHMSLKSPTRLPLVPGVALQI